MKVLIVNNKIRLNQQRNLTTFFESREVDSVEISHMELKGLDVAEYFAICLSGTGRRVMDLAHFYTDELDLIRTTALPVLGICGGFHLMALAYGGTLKKMAEPIYGRQDVELAPEETLFGDLSKTATFLSKHLYCLDYISPQMKVIARHKKTECVYGIKILEREQYGFQFHPERQNDGTVLLDSFLQLAKDKKACVINE